MHGTYLIKPALDPCMNDQVCHDGWCEERSNHYPTVGVPGLRSLQDPTY